MGENNELKQTEEIITTENNFHQEEDKQEKKPKAKNKKKILIITIIVMSILLCLCIVGFFVLNGKDRNSNEVSNKKYKSDYAMSGNSLENFDLYFLKLENEEKNKVYSPLSIKYALEMLSEGATGETKDQIDSIIGNYEARKYENSENMSFANALFIKDSFSKNIKDEYKQILTSKYYADVVLDSFETPENINKWISDKTFNLINNLLNDVSDKNYILVNALAIDMEWERKFLNKTQSVVYLHEVSDLENVSLGIYPLQNLSSGNFYNINNEISGMKIEASINNYDIVKELGEDNIRKTVGDAYREFINDDKNKLDVIFNTGVLKSGDFNSYEEYEEAAKNFVFTEEFINEEVNNYLDQYIETINTNYHKNGSTTDLYLYTDDNVKVFAKDLKEYNGTTLQYVGIMPTKESLSEYIEKVNPKEINNYLSNLKSLKNEDFEEGKHYKIVGFIPKFKFDYELNLVQDLNKLGIKDVFNAKKADLSNISTNKTFIGEAKHKATIEFTQDGIKASAATAMGGFGAAGYFDYYYEIPTELIDLTFNKPYMFLIRDKATGEVWFTGTVYEPLDWNKDLTKSSY